MNSEFETKLLDFFKQRLKSSKDKKCDGCQSLKKFITQVDKKGNTELIYTCGGTCGIKYGLVLPKYLDYDTELRNILSSMYSNINYGTMERYGIKVDFDYKKVEMKHHNDLEKLKELFEATNTIENRERVVSEYTIKKKDYLKNLNKLYYLIETTKDTDVRKQNIQKYLQIKKDIDELHKSVRNINDIQILIKVSDGKVVDSIEIIKKESKEKVQKTQTIQYENKETDIELYELTDTDKFSKRDDVFGMDEEKECNDSITWKMLDSIKNKKDYEDKVLEISTNPKYPTFNQIYFTAGDVLQFQRYGYLKTRLLEYPSKYIASKYTIYNKYNVDTTYQTFKYIFHYLKKGVYVSIKNGSLITYLPFNNIDYKNEWYRLIQTSENKENFDKLNQHTGVNPINWYANNCLITNSGMKYKYTSMLAEGDKTIAPFKHFLLHYLKHLQQEGIETKDVDFFFNPRDFPILHKHGDDPYNQITPGKKLNKKYIHKTYTPILSQCGHKDFNDICIPTEDDMMRITDNIYPDMCTNNYYGNEFKTQWKDKKSICVFRGGATGCGITRDTNMRIKACELSHEWKDDKPGLLDAKLTSWNNKRPKFYNGKLVQLDENDFEIDVKDNQLTRETQSTYKYILNIDGHVKAFRLGNELRMGSVVLIVESDYRLWFQEFLKENVHYISVNRDLTNLEEKIRWCQENDSQCEEIAKNSKDFYDKYLSEKPTYNYFHKLMTTLSNCRKQAKYTLDKTKMNIIVAYRNTKTNLRKKQLDVFIQQMTLIFTGRIDFHIYVIEQELDRDDYDSLPKEIKIEGTKMAKFNLGRLKNIGFQIADSERSGYYILTDVDIVPSATSINNYLENPTSKIIHLATHGTRYETDKKFIGGAISVNDTTFLKTNGYPNDFWGWGGEDEAFRYRIKVNELKVKKISEPIIDLEEQTDELKLDKEKSEPAIIKELKDNLKKNNETNWKTNGLSTVEDLYTITDRQNYDNISHIKVFLKVKEGDKSPEKKEPIVEPTKPPAILDKKIEIGSIVQWKKNNKEFEGEIIKITEKTYKVCCKPGKNKDEKGALYMISKNSVKLK